jgi:uroporphyrinogen decarboxylase
MPVLYILSYNRSSELKFTERRVIMNPRERYLETLLFGRPDRIPLEPGYGRESTRRAWHAQGLPAEIDDGSRIAEVAYRLNGGVREWPQAGEDFPVNSRMIPEFEEAVLERGARTQIVRDWKGNVCEISNEYSPVYLRNAIDFVTRRWIKCPVQSRADWDDMKWRYDPHDPARYPADAAARGVRLKERTWPLSINISGPFWQLREWLGFENLCLLFKDDPAFVKEMIAFWDNFVCELLEHTLSVVDLDEVHLAEDMAYKSFSMISPAMTRDFLLPVYQHWGEIIRAHGVPLYGMDSDGYIGQLVPIWMEAGINVCDPIEVAAGNDMVTFREQFGRRMAFKGGVDKRLIAQGGRALEDELRRLQPVIDSGGYIPSCDHGVPADVSWPNFVQYVGLLVRATGWL